MPDTTGQQKSNSTLDDQKKLFDQAKAAKRPFEPEWYMNIAFYDGKQWVRWDSNSLTTPKLEEWRIQVVDNRILPAVSSRVARKTKTRPSFVSTPASLDEDDLEAAEISTQVLDNDWNELNLHQKLYLALLWSDITCAGFWKIYWDVTKGSSEDYLIDADGKAMFDPESRKPLKAAEYQDLVGQSGIQTKTVAQGDIQVDVISPFELFPDPLATELEECEWIIEEKIRSPEYIKKKYNKDVEADARIGVGIAESQTRISVDTRNKGTGQYKGVKVYELWAPPSSKWGSKGKIACWTKDESLYEGDLSQGYYEGNPYVMFSCQPVPGRFWPTSITQQMRGPQVELNKIKSQIRESAVRLGNPALMSPRQMELDYRGEPGEHIEYDYATGEKPEYLNAPELPVYVQNEIERIESALSEISGIHEVSKATVPSGVTAASAINLLQEADDTRLGPEISDMEVQLSKGGTKIIKLRAKFQRDERTIQQAGEDGEWDIQTYKRTVLAKIPNIEVQAGSQMPSSKAAKQAAMGEFLNNMLAYGDSVGLQLDPRDIRKYVREYGVGGLEHMFASLSESERQVKREHNLMRNGVALPINDYDDDDYHIDAHDEFRRSRKYRRMPQGAQHIIDVHTAAHRERRVEAVNQQLAQQGIESQQAASTEARAQLENIITEKAAEATKEQIKAEAQATAQQQTDQNANQ